MKKLSIRFNGGLMKRHKYEYDSVESRCAPFTFDKQFVFSYSAYKFVYIFIYRKITR